MNRLADKLARAREVVAKSTIEKLVAGLATDLYCDSGAEGFDEGEHVVADFIEGQDEEPEFIATCGTVDDGTRAAIIVLAVNALPALLDAVEALLALRGEYVGVEDMLPYETTVHVQAIDAALARLAEVLP